MGIESLPGQRQGASSPPPTMTPPGMTGSGGFEHFVFSALMDVQKEIGRIEQSVSTLAQSSSQQADRLTSLENSVDRARTAVWIVGAMIAAAIAFVGWAIDKLPGVLAHLPKGP